MRKLIRTYLFGWVRKTDSISRYLELIRGSYEILDYTDTPAERYELLRYIDCLERVIKRIGRL